MGRTQVTNVLPAVKYEPLRQVIARPTIGTLLACLPIVLRGRPPLCL